MRSGTFISKEKKRVSPIKAVMLTGALLGPSACLVLEFPSCHWNWEELNGFSEIV